MKTCLQLAWRWSWVATLPIAVFFVVWVTGFATSYRELQLRFDVAPTRFGWLGEGGNAARAQFRAWRMAFAAGETPDLPVIDLMLTPQREARLGAEPPWSGQEETSGRLVDGDRRLKVDVRHRGDFLYHWAYGKKSWRIETKKSDRYRGLRKFNLVAPKFTGQVHDFLGYALAERLGLLSPRAELAWLRVNGAARGLYLLLEQPDESTLRDRGRMPGDLYRGELVARDAWNGIENLVFDHPGLWQKMAVNNHFPTDSRRPLQRLCELLAAPPSEELHRELGHLLDLDAFARLSALEILIGYFHTSEVHNWRLYWDPWRTRFEPLIWDPNAYGGFELLGPAPPVGLDPAVTRLHHLLHGNASFLAARQRVLREFLGDPATAWLDEVRSTIAKVRPAIDADPLLRPPDPTLVHSVIDRLPDHVARIHEVVRTAYVERTVPVRWCLVDADRLRVEVADRVAPCALSVRLSAPVPDPGAVHAELAMDRTGESVRRRLPVEMLDGGRCLRLPVTLPAQLLPMSRIEMGVLKEASQDVSPTTYDLVFTGLPPTIDVLRLDVERIGAAPDAAQRVETLPAQPLDRLYAVAADVPPPAQAWSGIRDLHGIHEIDGDLEIAAGTELRLHPGAAVLIRGRLTARGTGAAPIRITRAVATEAWATFALCGPRADGSTLTHVHIEGGSGLVDHQGLFEYCAMFSVHDADGVTCRDCSFRDNSVVDDMVHAVYSDIVFERCTFSNAPADMLDLDVAIAVVRDCTFERAGNDCVDLMTSRVLLDGCRLRDGGDKGVSVGEGSHLLAVDCQIDGCTFGVQSKDGSRAALAQCTFRRCQTALDAYKKNWRYLTGGETLAWRCTFEANTAFAKTDEHSRISVGGNVLPAHAPDKGLRVLTGGSAPEPDWLDGMAPVARERWRARASGS
ncbi:MAG: CotH kinase family protein [Planctomycetes bacterium]|nr:CotH kinase family protein [Planctomycetota bacterium]